MPAICRFYGIVIVMFFDEHNPPHFHARYGEHKGAINIVDLTLPEEYLPPRTLELVVEWAARHKLELLRNWELLRAGRPAAKIPPLD